MYLTKTLNKLEPKTIAAACVGLGFVLVNLVGFAGLWTPNYASQRASDAQLQSDWEAFTEGMNEDDLQKAYEESWLHWEFTSVRKVHYHGWPLPYLFRVEMLQVRSTYSRTATAGGTGGLSTSANVGAGIRGRVALRPGPYYVIG